MIERKVAIFTLGIFILINGFALVNPPHPDTKTLKLDSNIDYVIFEPNGIKKVKISIAVEGLNGILYIKYFNADVSSYKKLHEDLNELYISSHIISLYLSENSSVSKVTYTLYDLGFVISSFDIMSYIID